MRNETFSRVLIDKALEFSEWNPHHGSRATRQPPPLGRPVPIALLHRAVMTNFKPRMKNTTTPSAEQRITDALNEQGFMLAQVVREQIRGNVPGATSAWRCWPMSIPSPRQTASKRGLKPLPGRHECDEDQHDVKQVNESLNECEPPSPTPANADM